MSQRCLTFSNCSNRVRLWCVPVWLCLRLLSADCVVIPSQPWLAQIRLYVLNAVGLTPQDPNGLADPYVVVKLGDQKQGDASKCIKESLNPQFFTMYEFNTTLPGESVLAVSCPRL